MTRPSLSDLRMATEWLRSYEAAPEEDATGLDRVAAWIDTEIARRAEAAAVRAVCRETGATRARARETIRRHAQR